MKYSQKDLEDIIKSFQIWYKNDIHSKVEDFYSETITSDKISALSREEFLDFFLHFAKEGGKIQTGGSRTAERFIRNVSNNFHEFKQRTLDPFKPDFKVDEWIKWSESFNFFGKGLATIYLNRVDKTKYVIVNNKSIEAYRLLGYEVANYPLEKTCKDLLLAQSDFIKRFPEIQNFFVADALSEFLIGSGEGRTLLEKLTQKTSKILKLTRTDIESALERINKNPTLRKGRDSVEYDLIYNGNQFPPILVLSEANKIAGGQELLLTDFGNSTKPAFSILQSFGYVIEKKKSDFSQELLKFLSQSETTDLTTVAYPKNYRGLNVKLSFGQGNQARISWIAFLGGGNSVQNGIYPVFLYFKSKKVLVLAYGVSETNTPSTYWHNPSLKSIKDYFKEKDLGIPERYGNSFVFTVYGVTPDLLPDPISRDLDYIIELYKNQINEVEPMTPAKKTSFNYQSFNRSANTANLFFSNNLALRFVASLLTKPFVILTGLSGSGKTKLAQAFAMWICEEEVDDEKNTQYCIVPVGADWTNREPLLGFPNALEKNHYVKPDNGVLDLIISANANIEKPYFLILDEMNLSHVERYFADFLSVMETKTEIRLHSGNDDWYGVPAKIGFPKNLFIIGTVNIDETTYMFSPKVLDRASVIEFRVTAKDMEMYLQSKAEINLENLKGEGERMARSFVALAKELRFESTDKEELTKALMNFFEELKKTGAEFGYRSASEIIRFAAMVNKLDAEWKLDDIVDAAIMQKLLPKVHGSRKRLAPVLEVLGILCMKEKLKEGEKMEHLLTQSDDKEFISRIKYPMSFEKISRMYRALLHNGFTSYAEA